MTYVSSSSAANGIINKPHGNKNKRNKKRGNKAKEVQSWEEWESSTKNPEGGSWIPGTIPMSIIKTMKWGDIDELTNEEFGYFAYK